MKRVIEDVLVSWWLTWFTRVQGEITSSGSRWLKPQRTGKLPSVMGFEAQMAASSEVLEPFTMTGGWWSYQPSESSYVITMAVDDQNLDCSIWLIVFTRNVCSSSGSE